jgi:beta-galactosidase
LKSNEKKTFNGMCLAVIRSSENSGKITLRAASDKLGETSIIIEIKR